MFRKADYNLIYEHAANTHSAGYANDAARFAPHLSILYERVHASFCCVGFVQGKCFYSRFNRIKLRATSFPATSGQVFIIAVYAKCFTTGKQVE